jgi:hypothetical protein
LAKRTQGQAQGAILAERTEATTGLKLAKRTEATTPGLNVRSGRTNMKKYAETNS